MKKAVLMVLFLLLVSALCYAASPRDVAELNQGFNDYGTKGLYNTSARINDGNVYQEAYASANTTVLTNLALTGNSITGQPSFISLQSVDNITYYLWIGEGGNVLLASHDSLWYNNVFPDGSWKTLLYNSNNVTRGAAPLGINKVGGQ
jgi:hypothetical protein